MFFPLAWWSFWGSDTAIEAREAVPLFLLETPLAAEELIVIDIVVETLL